MREQNERLTCGLSAVYHRYEKRSFFLAAKQWTDARFMQSMSGNCKNEIHDPGHALREKGLQRQTSVSTLVSCQERRALAVPLINRLPMVG